MRDRCNPTVFPSLRASRSNLAEYEIATGWRPRNDCRFVEIARVSEEQAQLGIKALRTAHKLNILMAIFLPLTVVSGVFGMSMAYQFEASGWLFWPVLVAALALGLAMKAWVLRDS